MLSCELEASGFSLLSIFNWTIDLKLDLSEAAAIIVALFAAQVAHYLLFNITLRSATRRRGSFVAEIVAKYTSNAARLLLSVIAISVVLPRLVVPLWLSNTLAYVLEVAYIVSFAWLATGLVRVFSALINRRLPKDAQHDVQARRARTQVHLLSRILIGLIAFGALIAIVLTIPAMRNISAGLFASAGLLTLAVGMAARPTLGNLIAGIQVALTEPIRIDDAVVVEGEWGRVVEVNTTYVIIKFWDLRHLVVPLSYFIEKPFQNWTRYSSDLIGAVILYVDYTLPMEQIRQEYDRVLRSSPLWDGKTTAVQVTNANEHTMEVRFLMSAAGPSATFDLRCHVREKLIGYLQEHYPQCLPRARSDVAIFYNGPRG